MKTHYVYVILNYELEKFYIGSRSCLGAPEEDTKYMSSSKPMKDLLKKHTSGWVKLIVGTFATRLLADEAEDVLIAEYYKDTNCVNRARTLAWTRLADVSTAMKKLWADPKWAQRQKVLMQAGWAPDHQMHASIASRKPDVLKRKNAAIAAAFAKKRKPKVPREVWEPKRRAALKASWTPERRAARSEKSKIFWTPERAAAHAEKMRASWTPERRAAHSAKLKVTHSKRKEKV